MTEREIEALAVFARGPAATTDVGVILGGTTYHATRAVKALLAAGLIRQRGTRRARHNSVVPTLPADQRGGHSSRSGGRAKLYVITQTGRDAMPTGETP